MAEYKEKNAAERQHFFLCFKKEYQIPTRSQLGASGNFRGKV
ncbi:hypothetical protein [Ectobacillus funiculus]|jgi:hypothetical protein|uniref:Uncharacterized protein n=1 Tax=Ectobacillus funiculus TaxID=137993 RepID=A0ABV5WGM9_9BACI|nr:hypothetical protein [Ectobacillus funiculus]